MIEQEIHDMITLMKECAVRTDEQNKRLITAIRFQNSVYAVVVAVIVLISYAYSL